MEEKDVDRYADNTNFDDSNEEENSEEAPIPNSWNMDYSSAMVMNDGHDSAWEYHQTSQTVPFIPTSNTCRRK
jgi:hypothetical protein